MTLKRIAKWIALAIAAVILLVAARPLLTPRHHWRKAAPFSGAHLCNPYADIGDATPTTGPGPHWFRANFHAHSNAWEGKQPPCEVIAAYRKLGYELAEVSDHGVVSDTSACNPDYIPTYEHGANLRSIHFLAIDQHGGAIRERYPLWQGADQVQETIDRLKATASYVVVNHPCHNNALAPADFDKLEHYDAVDVNTKYCKESRSWDAALTSGYPAWCSAGDDVHNMASKWLGVRYLYIDADPLKSSDVLGALKTGHFLCGFKLDEATDENVPYPRSLTVSSAGEISLSLPLPAKTIQWIGPNGRVLHVDSNTAAAVFEMKDEPYVRLEVETGSQRAYYQPIRRCD